MSNSEKNIGTKNPLSPKKRLFLIIGIAAAVLAVVVGVILAVVLSGDDGPTPEPTPWEHAGEYYSPTHSDRTIILNSDGSFLFTFGEDKMTGSFTHEGDTLHLDFAAESIPDRKATYENGTVRFDHASQSLTFYEKVEYTVSFETNGGSEQASVKYYNGMTVRDIPDPVRDGYLFVGWYRDSEFTLPGIIGYPVRSDMTVYARWIEDTGATEVTVRFDSNDGSCESVTDYTTVGGRVFDVHTPFKQGHTFLGWWVCVNNDVTKPSYLYTEDTVFTAKYSVVHALWAKDGSGTIAPPSLSVSENGIEWSRVDGARSYLLSVTDGQGSVVFSRELTRTSVELSFADLPAGEYTVTVTANANTGAADNSVSYFIYKNKSLDKVTGIFVSDGSTLVFRGVENAERYLITVRCGDSAHKHTGLDLGQSKTFCFANCPMREGGIEFTVTAVAEGYVSSVSDKFIYENKLDAVEGFEWDGASGVLSWSPVENAFGYYVEVRLTVFTQSHPLITSLSTTECSVSLADLKNTGVRVTVFVRPFASGYSSESSEIYLDIDYSPAPSGIELNGDIISWDGVADAEKYEISVDGRVYESTATSFDLSTLGDLLSPVRISIRAVGESISAWSAPTVIRDSLGTPSFKNGILRWEHILGAERYEIQADGGEITEIVGKNYAPVSFNRAGEHTLKLRASVDGEPTEWVSLTVTVYAVSFDALGAEPVPTVYIAAGDGITLPITERLGYKFRAWYNIPGGAADNGLRIDGMTFRAERDITLYAYYIPELYDIVYNFGIGGSGESDSTVVEYERDYTLAVPTPHDPTVSFGGWFEAPNGKGVQYTDGSGVSLAPWSILGGAEVYAFWIDETLDFTAVKVNGKDAYSVSAGARISLVTEVTIPAYHGGLPVLMIDGNAFAGCKGLRVINIPASVEVISSLDPFAECTALEKINIYAVEGIGTPRYSSTDGVLFENKSGGSALLRMPMGRRGAYALPNGTAEISSGAFVGSAIESVVIASTVGVIGNDAFAGAASLSSVGFAEPTAAGNALTVGKRAFADCVSLASITLPARLAEIELSKFHITDGGKFVESADFAFAGCSSLLSVGIAAGSTSYRVIDGMIFDSSSLIFCPVARTGSVTVPLGTQSIGAGAFVGCSGITEVYIPNTVTYIGEYAFAATSLSRVTFGGKGFSSVTVGDNSFKDCLSLSDVVFEAGSQVAVIGESAFGGCTSLEKFTITQSVTSIRDNAFSGCTSLSTVIFDGGKKPLEFGKNVFRDCTSLTTVEIPSNVSKIPGIFSGCTSLTEVKVAEDHPSFVDVGGIVFSRDMTEIVYFPQGRGGDYAIPDTVRIIGAGVFGGNKTLTSLTIPSGITLIGEGAFRDTDIGGIAFSGGSPDGELVIEASAFERARFEGYDLVLPPHTVSIGAHAFEGVYYQSIVLPEGLRSIGDYAFYCPSNNNGQTLVIPASVESIGEYAFSGESIESSYVSAHLFFDVRFTAENSRLESIGDYAFYKNARLTSLTLPASVRSIGNYAFYECRSLSSVTLSASLESIGAYAFAASAYTYMLPITELTIPAGVSYVGARAFENCDLLTTVTFEGRTDSPDLILGSAYRRRYESDGIEMFSIERGGVFASCSKLKTVNLSPNIVSLGDRSFAESGDAGFTVNIADGSRLATVGAYCFYKSRLASFTLPASVRNLDPVTELGVTYDRLGIGEYAFVTLSGSLKSFTFEKGGESYPLTVGYGAFEDQTGLTEIELPARLATYRSADGAVISPLADGALVFYGARSLARITVEDGGAYRVEGSVLYTSDMRELVFCPTAFEGELLVPASVTRIGDYALVGCTGINGVEFLGNSALTRIGSYAFYGCTSIKSIDLPSGVSSLGEGVFCYASSLESLTLSRSLTSFDISVLDGCISLKSVLVEAGSVSLSSYYGVLYNSNRTSLILYPVGKTEREFVVPPTVLSIGASAFSANPSLEAVTLLSALREIGDAAFAGCTSLREIVIPAAVEIIGDYAFSGCASLTGVSFTSGGDTKLVIGASAFAGSAVKHITLPARLAYVGADAFRGSMLSTLDYEDGADQLTEIGAGAFAETPVSSVKLPSGIITVGDGAFLGTGELSSITFGEGLTQLGAEAFKYSALGSVSLPASLKSIGKNAFYGCTSLMAVDIAAGSQLESIGAGCFYGCTSLVEVRIPTLVTELGGEKDGGAFEGCTSLESVVFEADGYLTVIGDYAFFGCTSLAKIELPTSVGTLGKYAFSGCTSLREITVHHATVRLGEGLFLGCTSLESVELDTGADTLPAKMLEGCSSLAHIYIPAGISEIGDRCFFGTAIEGFEVATENKHFVSVSGILYNSSKTLVVAFPPNLKVDVLVIPKEVVEIKSNNFQNCTSIKEVVFEEGGTSPLTIGNYAFDGCYMLRRLVLPERLVSIGSYAFRNCNALTSVSIPKNLTSIGNYAFTGCAKLYEVYNESAIEDIAKKGSLNYVNNNYYSNAKVNVYTATEGASILTREGDFIFASVGGAKRLLGYMGNDSEITLPDGDYEIASYLFYNDTSITRVNVPCTVKMNGTSVFNGCTSLEAIYVSGGEIPSDWDSFWNKGITTFSGYTGEEIEYSFITGGAALDPIRSTEAVSLPESTLAGHVFLGWFDNPELSGDPVGRLYYSSQKTVLYASFMTEAEYIESYLRGQSIEYAHTVESGVTYTVDIREKGAQNYYAITAEAGESWNISTPSGYGNHIIYIYDADGKLIHTYYSATTYNVNYDYVFSKAGTYYVGVGYKSATHNPGRFTVTFEKG